MIVAIGVDTVAIARVEGLWQRAGQRGLDRLFAAAECAYCLTRHRPGESLAARFAAKEAVLKCLGTGWADGLGFRQIEVVRSTDGAVGVVLHAAAAQRAQQLGIRRWHLSLTHTATEATAFAIAEG